MKTYYPYMLVLGILVSFIVPVQAQAVCFRPYSSSNGYGAIDTFPSIGVADDYGPRRVIPRNWHGGIDYNDPNVDDYGHLLLAPFSGTIVDANRLLGPPAPTAKEIALDVGDYRYVFIHVFYTTDAWEMEVNDNTIVAKRMLGVNSERWAIIMNINGTVTAIGQINGFVIHEGDTLTVTNSIPQYGALGPLGRSGATLPHLHLNIIPDDETGWDNAHNKNPLQYVEYEAPQYRIRFFSQPDTNSLNLSYPGSAGTSLCVRPDIEQYEVEGSANRYNRIYDVNEVELLVKKTHESSFSRIRGARSESIISLGGRLGTNVINHTREQYAAGNWGSWNRTGVDSYAYNGSNTGPYDDYYFTDFITRIHEDDPMGGLPALISDCPMSARYGDGRYEIKARVTDIRNGYSDSEVKEFVLDNFKPIVQGVEVKIGSHTIYHRRWSCGDPGSCIGMMLESIVTEATINSSFLQTGMYVYASTSEPLNFLLLSVGPYNGIQPAEISADRKTFRFYLDPVRTLFLLSSSSVEFAFRGTDMSENTLLALQSSHAAQNCLILPTRRTEQAWFNDNIPQGTDRVHYFNPSCGGSGRNETPTVTIIDEDNCFFGGQGVFYTATAASNPQTANGRIELFVEGSTPPYSYTWSNGDTTAILDNIFPGQYIVTINDALCCEYTLIINVGDNCPQMPGLPYDLSSAVTHPSTCGASDGSLRIFSDSQYGIHLLPGPISSRRLLNAAGEVMPRESSSGHWYNLPAGMYTLELTGAGGCIYTGDVNLMSPDSPALDLLTHPCCIGQANGEVEAYGLSLTGAATLRYTWSTGLVQILPNDEEARLSGLPPGNYCVTVTDSDDSDNCATWACAAVPLISDSGPLNLNGQTTASCPGQHTGTLSVQIQGGVLPYTYSWSDGVPATTSRTQLIAGQYCLTITDYCGEQVSQCWEVQELPSFSVNISLTHDNGGRIQLPDGSEVEQHTGSILLKPEPAEGNYQYVWSNGKVSNSIHELSSGNYGVTVTETTSGCIWKHDFIIRHCIDNPGPSFEAQVLGDILEPNELTLDFRVLISEDNGPFSTNISDDYQIVWTWDGPDTLGYSSELSLPVDQFTGNWVKVTISNGCNKVELYSYIISCATNENDSYLQNTLVTYVERPCEGFSDGVLTLTIPNDADNPVEQILVNGFSVDFSVVLGNYATVTLGGLSGDIVHHIEVQLANCDLVFEYTLPSRPFTREFEGMEGDMCRYNLLCDDIVIEGELIPATPDWTNSEGNFLLGKCTTPLICSGQQGGTLTFEKQWYSALSYRLTLLAALLSGSYNQDYILDLLDKYDQAIGNAHCKRVRWCKGNLRLLGVNGIGVFPNSPSFTIPLGDGCVRSDCSADLGLACIDEDALYEFEGETVECSPRSDNLHVLWNYYEEISDAFPNDFPGSPLSDFILENGGLPEAKCTNVYYCLSDFSVLGSNLASVMGTCGTPIYVCGRYVGDACEVRTIMGSDGQVVGTGVLCVNNSISNNGGCDEINSEGVEFQIHCGPSILPPIVLTPAILCPRFFWPGEDDESALRIINTPSDPEGEVLIGFSSSYELGGAKLPKGIYQSSSKLRFEDFRQDRVLVPHRLQENIKRYVEDWENQQLSYLLVVQSGSRENLVYESIDTAWTVSIYSDQRLDLTDLDMRSSEVSISGIAQGTLFLSEIPVLTGIQGEYRFYMTLNSLGQLVDVYTTKIPAWTRPGKPLLTANGDWLMSGDYDNGAVVINNQNINMVASSGHYLAKSENNGTVSLLSDFQSSGSRKLQSIATNASINPVLDEQRYAMAFSGAGMLTITDVVLQNESSRPNLIIAALNDSGSMSWSLSIEESKINPNKFAMSFDSIGNLYLALTPIALLNIQGHEISHQGGDDIVLLKFSPEGVLAGYLKYATDRYENVSAMMFDRGVIYFGGEFHSDTIAQQIGNYQISDMFPSASRGYISFVYDSDFDGSLSAPFRIDSPLSQLSRAERFSVFPNPFGSRITAVYHGQVYGKAQLLLSDALGHHIANWEVEATEEINQWLLQLPEGLPSGLFDLRLTFSDQPELTTSIRIIKTK